MVCLGTHKHSQAGQDMSKKTFSLEPPRRMKKDLERGSGGCKGHSSQDLEKRDGHKSLTPMRGLGRWPPPRLCESLVCQLGCQTLLGHCLRS